MKYRRESTVVKHLSTQFVFPGAAGVGGPMAAEIADLTGARELWQLSQNTGKHFFIACSIVGRAEGAAYGVINERCARWSDFGQNIMGRAGDERRDSLAFDDVGDETNGLMAEGSVRHQQSQIDLCVLQITGDGGREFILNLLVLSHATHERKMKRRKTADDTAFLQVGQSCARKDNLRILLGHSTDS
jgi:hypothetical protein